MSMLYPPIEPYEVGMLDVGDGNLVYWEACGNPLGKPTVVVHGGPGSGCTPAMRRYFDPQLYKIVLFDQRGCGRSTPHASDPSVDMYVNTTDHLVADIEQLRERLGVRRWLLYGGSWGSTLLLRYAEDYPDRVSEIVVAGVTTSRRSEIEWLYRGVGRFFPEQWEQFLAGVPGTARNGDLVDAYAKLTESAGEAVREKATMNWCAWEDAVLSGETGGTSNPYCDRPVSARSAMVRICAHYFSHGAWLEEGQLLRNAGRLNGIRASLIHGRLDLGSPLETAWELVSAWPGAELIVVESAGHLGNDSTRAQVLAALDRFARTEL